MKKKCLILLMICLILILPVFAAAPRLADGADYLTDGEAQELLEALDEISVRQGMDIVIVTVPSLNGRDISACADDFYDSNGYGDDGILLLIADLERQWAISTTGDCIAIFNDAAQDYMADQFVEELSRGNNSRAFLTFAALCDEIMTQAGTKGAYEPFREPFPVGTSLLICLAIGLVIALITTGIMRSKLKSVRPQKAAPQYVKANSLRITDAREIFLYRNIQRRARETQSTRMGSSGRSHGGSRGSF